MELSKKEIKEIGVTLSILEDEDRPFGKAYADKEIREYSRHYLGYQVSQEVVDISKSIKSIVDAIYNDEEIDNL